MVYEVKFTVTIADGPAVIRAARELLAIDLGSEEAAVCVADGDYKSAVEVLFLPDDSIAGCWVDEEDCDLKLDDEDLSTAPVD
jgi:hypothetical protein